MTSNQRFLFGLIPSDTNRLHKPAVPSEKTKRRIERDKKANHSATSPWLERFRQKGEERKMKVAEKAAARRLAEQQALDEQKRLAALAEAERQANLKANEENNKRRGKKPQKSVEAIGTGPDKAL